MDAVEVLRAARRRTGLSQRDFARLAGVSARTLAGAEAGEHAPSWSVVDRACTAAGVALTVDVVPEPSTRVVEHLRLSLTRRLWASFGGTGRPADRWGPAARTRPAGWCGLVEVALQAEVVLRGTEALRLWLPSPYDGWCAGQAVDWPSTALVARAGRSATEVAAGLSGAGTGGAGTGGAGGPAILAAAPPGLVAVPLAAAWPHVLVPTPLELALEPGTSALRGPLLAVAAALHQGAPVDEAGRRTAAHRDPDHLREHVDTWHDKRWKRLPMPPAYDVRSWRLDDDASRRTWLGRYGMQG